MADVALLGAGRMGAAIVHRLVAAGHTVTVWNRTPAAVALLIDHLGPERLHAADSPAEAVAGRDVIFTVLADGEITRAVLLEDSVLASIASGTVVDLGTSGVETAHALAAQLRAAGARFVDAPVSGSVQAVHEGTLLVMASGDPTAVSAAAPLLAAFARTVLHVGDAGAGQMMKLVVNLVVHVLNAAVSEALRLAENSSVSREAAYSVLQHSVVGAPFVQYKRAAFLDPSTPVAMSLALVEKDLHLITTHARSHGEPAPVTEQALATVRRAIKAGLAAHDMSDLSRFAAGGPLREMIG